MKDLNIIITNFEQYLAINSTENSNKSGSYIRAINKLNRILKVKTNLLKEYENLWLIDDYNRLVDLYKIIKEEQKKNNGGFFEKTETPSYWKYRFYSAAVKSLAAFSIISKYEKNILDLAQKNQEGEKFAQEWENQEIPFSQVLLDDDNLKFDSLKGKETLREIKTRNNQNIFRNIILRNYNYCCCLTNLPIIEVLEACHITSWKEDKENRLNPENGLCLSATYHLAFDRNLISLDNNYRLILSPILKEYHTNEVFKLYFKNYENKPITLPVKFLPSKVLLEKHRSKLKT